MREILFRGKSLIDNEWVIGAGVYKSEGYIWIITDDATKAENRGTGSDAIIPETVGQFTGLTDKNGKKIFEGDVVKREFTLWHGETKKTRETQIGVVVYSNRDCGFQVEKKCNLRKPWGGDTIEVIGNIHDNPELLERSNENG